MLSGRNQEIRRIYDQHVQSNYGSEVVLEVEAKFGFYGARGFNSNVPYVHFERLLNLLRVRIGDETIEESHVAQQGNIRRITTVQAGDAPENVLWQRKQRIKDIELREYDIRVSVNREETLHGDQIPDGFKPGVIRDRTRHTFIMGNGLIRVDLTEVMMSGEDKIVRPRYEVEAEFLGNGDQLNIFEEHISVVFRLLRGTNIVFSNTTKNILVQDTIRILGSNPAYPDKINKDVLVEARNIKRRDLVYGGIVGNRETSYMITYKADGLRKMLIIHSTGVWLVYPPFEFNLVLDLTLGVPRLDHLLKGFGGTIFDGELVVPIGEKQVSHWYLAFDCLAFRGSSSIQNSNYNERRKIVDAIAGALKTQFLTVDTKRTAEINTPQEFFSLVSDFLSKRDTLEYKEDGLMFFPVNTVYNPHSERHELYKRSLTSIPDTCKFKESIDITIDFSLRWVDNNLLDLYVFDPKHGAKGSEVPFRGDIINPVTPDMIDYNNPLISNKPSGTVVEFEYVSSTNSGIFRPRRIRYDKSGPNRLAIALDDWEDIRNPITREDIEGHTLMMTTSYHNRIKKGLYGIIPRGSNILDIGSGRGGDASKWNRLPLRLKGQRDSFQPGTGLVVAVEPNSDNRVELVSRINTFGLSERVTIVPTGGEDTVSITEAVRRFVPGGKVDAVTLMLSMSFFWASDSHLDALVNTIVTNLKPGGMVIFLTINGDVVEQIFEPSLGGPWITDKRIVTADIHLYPRPTERYDISDNRQGGLYGRPLDFNLPDTIVGAQREYLVQISDFTTRLSRFGINLYELHRAEGEKLLSHDNLLFSSMYSYGYFVNDDETYLEQNNQMTHTPVNIPLPIIPQTIISPTMQMSSPSSPSVLDAHSPLSVLPLRSSLVTTSPSYVNSPGQGALSPSPANASQTPVGVSSANAGSTSQTQPLQPVKPPNQALPRPTKYQIDQNQLPWLKVTHGYAGSRNPDAPSINDDTYAPLTCTWYNDLVRIATIGDGSCFIHAVLKGFFRQYQENNSARFRLSLAAQVRRDLAVALGMRSPKYPGHTYWGTSARGAFPRMVMQQLNDESLVGGLRVDYSLAGLQRLFNSATPLGDEVYSFVSDALNVDIYVLRATRTDLYPHSHTRTPGVERPGVVVVGNTYHYEVVAVNGDNGFQTTFLPGDPFLLALTNLFVGDGGFEDILNVVPYDPDESFVRDIASTFVQPVPNSNPLRFSFQLPPEINDIFPESDPFRVQLSRLQPRILEAARYRIARLTSDDNVQPEQDEHPTLIYLDRILDYLQQSGFPFDDMIQLRQIVQHRIDPDIPQDLDSIIASAETDGLLSPETVSLITAAKAAM